MRYTKKFIQARFEMAMKAIGAPTGETYSKVGNKFVANVGIHFIDHVSIYGGYTIGKIVSDTGGESRPFGNQRYKASEFVALLDGIMQAAWHIKGSY